MGPGQAEIDFARSSEGHIYGQGTAKLIEDIRTALMALPAQGEPTFRERAKYPMDPQLVAETIHGVLKKAAEAEGMKPDIETFMRVTGEEGNRTYKVSWEAGPYQWAIQASFVIMEITGRLVEPYYSFDLDLYDRE